MTIKQCYQAMGADFEEISQRIPSEAMIRKFAVKFPEDKSFAELTKALELRGADESTGTGRRGNGVPGGAYHQGPVPDVGLFPSDRPGQRADGVAAGRTAGRQRSTLRPAGAGVQQNGGASPGSGLTGGGKQAVAAVHRGEDLRCMNIRKQKADVDTLFCKRKQEGMAVWNDRRS